MTAWLVRISSVVGAAALFCVMCIIFASVALRYFFGYVLPDAFDLSRMFLGILIFWGIALALADDALIKVDALYGLAGRRGKRAILAFSALVTALVIAVLAWRAGSAVVDAYGNRISTNDLRLRLWPFYALAATALVLSVAIAVGRVAAALTGPLEEDGPGADE